MWERRGNGLTAGLTSRDRPARQPGQPQEVNQQAAGSQRHLGSFPPGFNLPNGLQVHQWFIFSFSFCGFIAGGSFPSAGTVGPPSAFHWVVGSLVFIMKSRISWFGLAGAHSCRASVPRLIYRMTTGPTLPESNATLCELTEPSKRSSPHRTPTSLSLPPPKASSFQYFIVFLFLK